MAEKTQYNLMVFPNGPMCNLKCEYCYYLEKTNLYPETKRFQMSDAILEEYTKQYIASIQGPVANFSWQGGEPLLSGLEFFEKAMGLQDKYLPAGWSKSNILQTNGTLLTEEWCTFFRENEFLIGISIDGPEDIHDIYRKDKNGVGTHKKVMEGLALLQKHHVEYNVLCTLNKVNAKHPVKVYEFFKDCSTKHIQFIPAVSIEEGDWGIDPELYGRFLITVFEYWRACDIGKIFIQTFEECLAAWAGGKSGLCVYSEECGLAPVMEYNGDVYSCDHFVSPEHKLGNITEISLSEMMASQKQKQFGKQKCQLPEECKKCEFLFMCNGGCLRSRTHKQEEGVAKDTLCYSYKQFFNYIDEYMKILVAVYQERLPYHKAVEDMDALYQQRWGNIGKNEACSCGSGKKYKNCCYIIQREGNFSGNVR